MSGRGASGKKKITPSSSKDFTSQDARSETTGKQTKESENREKNEFNKTSRGSSNTSNNPASPKSKKTEVDASPSQHRVQESAFQNPDSLVRESSGNPMLDRSLWLLMNLVGKQVEVQVKNGDVYEGIFHAANVGGVPGVQEKNFGVVLKMARKKEQKTDGGKKVYVRPIDTFVIFPSDFVQLYAKDVGFDINSERDAFATDTEISGGFNYKERELQRWVPDEEIPDDLDLSLNDRERSGGWDQFQINREKFGVETTWDERLYTTEINPEMKKKLFSEADRLAKEIEHGTKGNSSVHLLEERGQEVDLDEEDRYGAVLREPATAQNTSGKYVPPQRRVQQSQSADDKSKSQNDKKDDKQPKKDGEKKNNIQKTESMEEFPPESPGSPLPPLSPGETHPLVAERLRLRLHLVNEKLKNSAPVPDKQNPVPHRSPLLSPLVGDAKAINALSLEPSTPTLPETVLKDFMDFSLAQKAKEAQQQQQQQQSQRAKAIADLKNFSAAIEKRVSVKPGSTPSSPRTSQKNSPQATSPVEEKTAQPTAPAKETKPAPATAPAKETKPAPTTAPAKEAKPTPTTTPAKTETTAPAKEAPKEAPKESKPEEKEKSEKTDKETTKSKLNPNAKAFKPMSATAPAFTPSIAMAPVPVMVPAQEGWFAPQDPYMAMGPRQPVYPVPFGTPIMTPSPVMIPGPQMRVVPPMGYPVPVMPGYPGQSPMFPPVPNPAPNQPTTNTGNASAQSQAQNGQNGKRYPPSKNANPAPANAYPTFVPQGRGGPVVVPQPFFPGQYGVVPGQPFYPPMVDGQGKDGDPKFQGVPNTDNMQK